MTCVQLMINKRLCTPGYFVSQLPSNVILQRVGAPLWLACIMVCWGAVALGFAFITCTRLTGLTDLCSHAAG